MRTYDVSVEDNHNFYLANGLLSHNSEDLLCICEMPSPSSREATCMPLKRDRRMNSAQIMALSVLPIHQLCVVPRGERARILKRIQPPRCKYWKSEYGNFTSQWRKEHDTWRKASNDVDIINNEYEQRKEICTIKRAQWAEANMKLKKKDDEEDDFEDDQGLEENDNPKEKENENLSDNSKNDNPNNKEETEKGELWALQSQQPISDESTKPKYLIALDNEKPKADEYINNSIPDKSDKKKEETTSKPSNDPLVESRKQKYGTLFKKKY